MEWLIGLLPFALIVLLCPLVMFFFMRGAHGGHSGQASDLELENSAERITQLEGQVADLSLRLSGANGDVESGVAPSQRIVSNGANDDTKVADEDR